MFFMDLMNLMVGLSEADMWNASHTKGLGHSYVIYICDHDPMYSEKLGFDLEKC